MERAAAKYITFGYMQEKSRERGVSILGRPFQQVDGLGPPLVRMTGSSAPQAAGNNTSPPGRCSGLGGYRGKGGGGEGDRV